MILLITCPFGLSSLLNSELKRLWCKPYDTFPTGTYVEWDLQLVYKINLWSRIANKVFILMGSAKVFSFDELFDLTKDLDWWKYLIHRNLSIDCHTTNSKLFAERTIQSICHKAVLAKLEEDSVPNESMYMQDIFVHIENDFAQIFLNTSGNALHNRWYRIGTGEAPLKENIAAGLVLLAGWRFSDKFLDPFCWSWTILIEAAMIAKNMAPWLKRKFNFQKFPNYDSELFLKLVEEAKEKEFAGEYQICWSDSSNYMIDIAKKNIYNAWVEDCVSVECVDLFDLEFAGETIVCNPPYGKRLEIEDIEWLYQRLMTAYDWMLSWWFLTSFPLREIVWYNDVWKTKEINNNGEMCKFWRMK